jgi:hypothetical protein
MIAAGSRPARVPASDFPEVNQEVFSGVIFQTDPLPAIDSGTKREQYSSLKSTAMAQCLANPQPEPDLLEVTTDQGIAANEQLQASVSNGYIRGSLPLDRKDWYD